MTKIAPDMRPWILLGGGQNSVKDAGGSVYYGYECGACGVRFFAYTWPGAIEIHAVCERAK